MTVILALICVQKILNTLMHARVHMKCAAITDAQSAFAFALSQDLTARIHDIGTGLVSGDFKTGL